MILDPTPTEMSVAERAISSARLTVPPASVEHCRRLVTEFRRFAILLSTTESAESLRTYRREAAQVLVRLAAEGDEANLASILSFGYPGEQIDATWTVACYQLGDLSPSALRDFASAVEAVQLLQRCPSPAHLAAELVVSGSSGRRWTALVRTGTEVEFEPVGSSAGSGELVAESAAWEARLRSWSQDITSGLYGPVPAAVPAAPVRAAEPTAAFFPGPPPPPPSPYLTPSATPPAADAGLLADIGDALGQVVEGMRRVGAGAAERDALTVEVLARLDQLEDQVGDLQRRLDQAVLGSTVPDPTPTRRWRRRSARGR